VYRILGTNKKINYKNFLHEVGRSWMSEGQNKTSQILMTFNCQRSKQHHGLLKITHQADSGEFKIHKLEKIVAGEEGE
jgi:hypothetical protein